MRPGCLCGACHSRGYGTHLVASEGADGLATTEESEEPGNSGLPHHMLLLPGNEWRLVERTVSPAAWLRDRATH